MRIQTNVPNELKGTWFHQLLAMDSATPACADNSAPTFPSDRSFNLTQLPGFKRLWGF